MKNGFTISFWILLLVQLACTKYKDLDTDNIGSESIIEIIKFPDIGRDTLKTSFFADTIIYIPLETKEECFIKRIKQVWVNDSIIIINNHINLLMFSRNGSFIKQIGKQGNGPEEYQTIFRFDVIKDTIFLSSSGKKSLLKFTLDGKFCDEIQINGQPVLFSSTSNGKFAWYHRMEGKIYLYDDNFKSVDTITVEYGVSKDRYNYGYWEPFMTYFHKTPTNLLFNDYINDTVWNITLAGKEPAFILDMKYDLLPRNKQIEFSEGDFERWRVMARNYQMVQIVPYPNWMFFFQKQYYSETISTVYIQNLLNKEIHKFNTSFIHDDKVGQLMLSHFLFTDSQEFLVCEISPFELHENINTNRNNIREKANPNWFSLMENINKIDNPVLILIKVKKGEL